MTTRGDSTARAARARAERGMVATTDARASRVGAQILEAGGNAVDAAVASAFALAVVNPEAGNLGGGGFMLRRGPDGGSAVLDFRSVSPASCTVDHGGRGVEGHGTAAVPGSVRGLAEAHSRFGRMKWDSLVEPSIALADGFEVGDRLIRSFQPHVVTALRRFPASAAVFLPRTDEATGAPLPPRVGDVFRQPDLAATLRRIRDRGGDEAYTGRTAALVVEEMKRGGGHISASDLERYRPLWRDAVSLAYRGRTVISSPPPSSGGLTLALMTGLWARVDPGGLIWHSTDHVHLLAEIWRRTFSERNRHLADPEAMELDLEELRSVGYLDSMAGTIRPDRASASSDPFPGGHTTHLSVVDGEGAAVSLTTTINTWYGSKVVVEGAGFLLNSDMDDFTSVAGDPNDFGLRQARANVAGPGKRMASTMCPTIVVEPDDGRSFRPLLVLGSPGGATIPTSVFQVLSNRLDFGMDLGEAVEAPRVHHQHLPDELRVEPRGLDPEVISELRARGHRVIEVDDPWGDVQAIECRSDGSLIGVSDGRRGGAPSGV